MSLDWNVFWRIDAKTDAVSTDFQDSDFDFVRHYDFLIFFPANDQHGKVY